MADYDGDPIFGRSVTIRVVPEASAKQLNAFFGLSGVISNFGGGRGRVFLVTGILVGTDLADLAAVRANFESYDDGIARTLTDATGMAWSNVIYDRFEPGERIVHVALPGFRFGLDYRCTFRGLE